MNKLRISAFLLALIIVFSLVPLSAANSTVLRTSMNEDNRLTFTISGSSVKIEGKVVCENLTRLWLRSKDITSQNEYSKIINVQSGEYFSESLSLSGITEPTDVTVYTYTEPGDGYFWSYVWDTAIVEPYEGGYRFKTSAVADHNEAMLSRWINPADALGEVSTAIKTQSDEICRGISGDYSKIFALHKWVAENIYYDFDYYYGRSQDIFYKADDVLTSRRSVCEGYARLLMALIRAQGIPAILTTTYAAGISVTDFERTAPTMTESNHAHVEAFVEGRWVTMDATWDSKNKYEYGKFIAQAPDSFYYFDISPECFAFNHKIIEREGASAKDTPADWAKPELSLALSYGLVPASLQRSYGDDITRLDFCTLLMNMLCKAEGADSIEQLLAGKGITNMSSPFRDVNDIAVSAASKLGIVNGISATEFAPDASIKRKEAATMIMRAASVLGVLAGESGASFTDTAELSKWAYDGIAFTSSLVSSAGTRVMGGVGYGAFAPESTFTRQQAMLTVYRLYGCK